MPRLSMAQQCTFHRDCTNGTFCDGTCKPPQQVLASKGRLFWVDQATGNDQHDGSQTQPWKTIARATQSVQAGDAVLMRAGVYREAMRPRTGGTTNAYLTFAAYPGEEVIVTGADVVNRPGQSYHGWQHQNDGSWRHAWIWSPSREEKFAAAFRTELFVDNGQVLLQRGGRTLPQLQRGQFWIEGPGTHPVAVYLKTVDGTNPNEHTIEIGQRNQLFYSHGEGSGKCGSVDQGYYRLIGLTFIHGTSKRQEMVVCPGKQGSLLEEIDASWNNAGGIKLVGRGHIVRGATASHNGIEGIGGTHCTACIIEHNTIAHNNWKGEPGQAHGGGGKFTRTRHAIFRNNTYTDNNGPGLWMDNDNHDNEIYANRLDQNVPIGIFIEHGSSRNRIYNNVVTCTRLSTLEKNPMGIGIFVSASDSNLIAYNTLIGNKGSGVKIAGDNRRDAVGNLVYNNLFVPPAPADPGSWRAVVVVGDGTTTVPGNNTHEKRWARAASNQFDGNAYWPREGPSGKNQGLFLLSPGGMRTRQNLYSNQLLAWQESGYDLHGLVIDPHLPTIKNPADPVRGWHLAPGSQYIGRAVRLPPGNAPILTDFFGHPRPASGGAIGAQQRQ